MKYQLEITTLLVPVNVHQLFEKCEWPELNSFDKEMVENYFSDLVMAFKPMRLWTIGR